MRLARFCLETVIFDGRAGKLKNLERFNLLPKRTIVLIRCSNWVSICHESSNRIQRFRVHILVKVFYHFLKFLFFWVSLFLNGCLPVRSLWENVISAGPCCAPKLLFLAQWEGKIHKMRAKAIDSRDKDLFLLVDRVFLFQKSPWFRLVSDDKLVISVKVFRFPFSNYSLSWKFSYCGKKKFSSNLSDPETHPDWSNTELFSPFRKLLFMRQMKKGIRQAPEPNIWQ